MEYLNESLKATLNPNSCSQIALTNQLVTLTSLMEAVKNLAYKRISDSNNLRLVLQEKCGTCSSKHGFVKKVAEEQKWDQVKLILLMFKMNEGNTPGIGTIISDNGLLYLPEAHCIIEIEGVTFDLTNSLGSLNIGAKDILLRKEIQSNQIGAWKREFHRNYLKEWVDIQTLDLDFDKLWELREQCILNLSKIDG